MTILKNLLFILLVIPAMPLFFYLIWTDQIQELADKIKSDLK